MAVRCFDLLELDVFHNLKLLGGADGLDKIVRCPYVTLTNTIDKWVRGGELVFVSIKDLGCNEEQLLNLLQEGYKKNLAGIVLLIEADKKIKLKKMIDKADQYYLPLFEMPYELPLLEVTEEISSFIIKDKLRMQFANELMLEILSAKIGNEQALQTKAKLYHYDISGAQRIAIISLENLQEAFGENDELLLKQSLTYMEYLQGLVDTICRKNKWYLPGFINGNMLILLLPAKEYAQLNEMLHKIYEYIRDNLDNPHVFISVGREYSILTKMQCSQLEAMRVKQFAVNQNKNIVLYDDLGFYQILYEVNDRSIMEEFCKNTFCPLLIYDEENHTDLLKTLQIYLEENGNLVKTAKQLYIHRNSLIYRIKKIEEIMQESLADKEVCEKYRQALWIKYFLSFVNKK